jgi:ADP-heptose:LPS heptosyltransferase
MLPPASPFEPGLLRRLDIRRVALFRASRIGDFVCATPAFRALRAALPDARITLVGLPIVRELAARSPTIDAFEPFPGMPGIAEQFFDAGRAARFLRRMQEQRFDLAIQMHGSGVYSNPIVLTFGAGATAGFVREGDDPGRLDGAFTVPEHLPEVERLLAFAAFLGAPARGRHTDFPLRKEDQAEADRLLAGLPTPLVGLQPGARDKTKRWPPERFAAAGNRLRAARGGTVVVLGGPEDRTLAERVAAHLDGCPPLLCDRMTVPVLGAVIGRLAALITNDSGPAHVAYALGTPTITVFGGTDPSRWRPLVPGPFRLLARDARCRPCAYEACPFDDACLRAVSVEDVVLAASELMDRAPASPRCDAITPRKNASRLSACASKVN